MEAPPDIRKRTRKESMSDLLLTLKMVRATKAASSGMERIGKDEWEPALEDFREAQELFEELKDVLQASNMLSMQALSLFALDRLDEAENVMRRAIALKSECHEDEGKATDLIGLGEILLKKGDAAKATSAFEEAADVFTRLGLADDAKRADSSAIRAKKALEASV